MSRDIVLKDGRLYIFKVDGEADLYISSEEALLSYIHDWINNNNAATFKLVTVRVY